MCVLEQYITALVATPFEHSTCNAISAIFPFVSHDHRQALCARMSHSRHTHSTTTTVCAPPKLRKAVNGQLPKAEWDVRAIEYLGPLNLSAHNEFVAAIFRAADSIEEASANGVAQSRHDTQEQEVSGCPFPCACMWDACHSTPLAFHLASHACTFIRRCFPLGFVNFLSAWRHHKSVFLSLPAACKRPSLFSFADHVCYL